MKLALFNFLIFVLFSRRKAILIAILTSSFFMSQAQETKKDSLIRVIKTLEHNQDFSAESTSYIDLLNDLGYELRYYQTDSLFSLADKAFKLSQTAGYQKGESRSNLNLGNYYSDLGQNGKAIDKYTKAMEMAKSIEDSVLLLSASNNLAGEFGYKGDYAKALSGYLQCIELATDYDDKKMLSIVNENIANLYASQKDYKPALVFFKRVKKINQEIGNEIYSAETMSNMASLYADMGKLEYAMFNINSSIAVFEKNGIMDWLAYAYEIKGKTYLKKGNFKWALYWYDQSEMLHQELQDVRGQIDLFNGMAEAHLGMMNDSISEDYALRSYKISTNLKFKESIKKCANTLYKIHKNKHDYAQALIYHEQFQKLSDTLSRLENSKSLSMLKTKLEYDEQKKGLILDNEKALAKQKSYVYAALAILMIFLVVTFLIRRNEKIQKNLNVELLANREVLENREKELKEINATKDKLFSIIGHDLRGPIGAFQGLMKLFKEGDIGQKEFLEFIPKLGTDLDHISFTLNNLLTWGQTQMNGAVTKPTVISLDSIVTDNIKLLSEIATNKSIKLVSQLAPNTLAYSDGDQIDIVIRNLVSNALKFTPDDGMVTIGAVEKNNHWEVFVRDTGVGMDVKTQKMIFADNSSLTTYGTNNEKGTGLGLSLCKEMVEKNNGTIWVDSIKRKGSCFYFTLPKAKKEYQKAS